MSKATTWLKEAFAMAFKSPPVQKIWEWLNDHVEIPPILASKFPGQWSVDVWPPGQDILEAAQDRTVRKITLVAGARMGKTFLCYLIILWRIVNRPGPVFFVDYSAEMAKRVSLQELQPMMLACPPVKDLVINSRTHWTRKEMILRNGVVVGMAGSNSPGALSGRPAEMVILNELDKWDTSVTEEAPPARLAEIRSQAYEDTRLILENSTPTSEFGEIWKEFKISTEEWPYVPCPHCGDYQRFTFFREDRHDPETGEPMLDKQGRKLQTGRIYFEDCKLQSGDYDYQKIRRGVHFECQSCKKLIPWSKRAGMIRKRKWVSHNRRANKEHRGYHMGGPYSAFTSWMEGVIQYLAARGDMGKMMAFFNSYLGLPFRPVNASLSEKKIKEIIAASPVYRRNKLTFTPEIISMTVDVQKEDRGFWFTIWAWDETMRMFLLDWGNVISWEDVEETMAREWAWKGETYGISEVAIDMQHRSTEVWDFRLAHGEKILCMQGSGSKHQLSPIRQLEKEWEGVKFSFWSFIDAQFKYELYVTRLGARKGRPMFLPQMESTVGAKDGVDSDLINQLTDEVLDKDGNWVSKTGAKKSENNHLGDGCKMACVLDRLYHARLAELEGQKDEAEYQKEIAVEEDEVKQAA
jgi:phage terminase large subunit GpA-like protein